MLANVAEATRKMRAACPLGTASRGEGCCTAACKSLYTLCRLPSISARRSSVQQIAWMHQHPLPQLAFVHQRHVGMADIACFVSQSDLISLAA